MYAKSNYMNQPEFVFPPKVLPPKGASSGLSDFASRQVTLAKDCVQDGLDTGNRLFDVVRAMVSEGICLMALSKDAVFFVN